MPDLVELRDRTIEGLRVLAGAMRPAPASLVLFGSFAGGEGDAESDIRAGRSPCRRR